MDKLEYRKRMLRIEKDAERLSVLFNSMRDVDFNTYKDVYCERIVCAAVEAEYLLRKIRNHVNETVNSETSHMAVVADYLGITVNLLPCGTTVIKIPALIPKKKKASTVYTGYLTDPLAFVLSDFLEKNQSFRSYIYCDIHITQYYTEMDFETGFIRDYDNLELKAVIDCLNTYILTDDGGKYCDVHLYCRPNDARGTEIVIKHRNPAETIEPKTELPHVSIEQQELEI